MRTINFQYGEDPGTIYTKRSEFSDNGAVAQKRSSKPRARDTRLVKSSIPNQSAVELCESATSFGPDFVNVVEGMYCDMSTKTALPLCPENLSGVEGAVVDGLCFDLNGLTTLLNGVLDEVKNFTSVLDWGEGKAS